ncbi:hypothetical protein V6N13_053186 [Hibiscus sabdariffa]
MIETFDPGVVNPRSSRKHRRLDDNPSDGGGESHPVGPIPPPSAIDPTVAPNQDDGDVGSFGPWTVAEWRPRRNTRAQSTPKVDTPTPVQGSRFSPILTSDMDEEFALLARNKVVRPKASVPSSLHQSRKTSVPPMLKANAKKKMILAGKALKVTPMRKPLIVNLSDFPILSRFSAKASSSKPATRQGTLLDSTRHSATTMKENAKPNIVHSGSAIISEQVEAPILGDPLDASTGTGDQLDPLVLPNSVSENSSIAFAQSNHNTDGGRVVAMLE